MNILITGALKNAENVIEKIKSYNNSVFYMEDEKGELPISADKIDGVICNGLFLYKNVEDFKSLKYVQLTSAGLERVNVEYLKAHGIKLFNARGVYDIPMAEHAVSGVLYFYKNLALYNKNKKDKLWIKDRNAKEIFGKTVLIVGCGSVGTECAKKFSAFTEEVFGMDLYVKKSPFYKEIFPIDKLEEKLTTADVVVITLPLDKTTEGLFDEAKFEKMKEGSLFINISRGKVVKEDAMKKALNNKLLGAVLDVFNEEPLLEQSWLWEQDNVLLTPHVGFIGDGNNKRLEKLIIDNFTDNFV